MRRAAARPARAGSKRPYTGRTRTGPEHKYADHCDDPGILVTLDFNTAERARPDGEVDVRQG
ncbi:hypothetical protein AcW1_001876 [Taiwanofungus camphoratus]|nr:hypothetical protein AcW1_001876 [Antrodia cinnamomea]